MLVPSPLYSCFLDHTIRMVRLRGTTNIHMQLLRHRRTWSAEHRRRHGGCPRAVICVFSCDDISGYKQRPWILMQKQDTTVQSIIRLDNIMILAKAHKDCGATAATLVPNTFSLQQCGSHVTHEAVATYGIRQNKSSYQSSI